MHIYEVNPVFSKVTTAEDAEILAKFNSVNVQLAYIQSLSKYVLFAAVLASKATIGKIVSTNKV